jgi:hypothetical protein
MKKRTSAYKPAFTMRSNFFVYSFVATSKLKPLHSIKWITELACKPYPPSALPLNASTAWFAYNIRSSFVPQKQIACFVFLLEHALRGIFDSAAIFGLGLL